MTKLEEKLLELGYEYINHNHYYKKRFTKFVYSFIDLNSTNTRINDYGVETPNNVYRKQEQLDNLQQAFNQLQKDLEVLKEYEKNETKSVWIASIPNG